MDWQQQINKKFGVVREEFQKLQTNISQYGESSPGTTAPNDLQAILTNLDGMKRLVHQTNEQLVNT